MQVTCFHSQLDCDCHWLNIWLSCLSISFHTEYGQNIILPTKNNQEPANSTSVSSKEVSLRVWGIISLFVCVCRDGWGFLNCLSFYKCNQCWYWARIIQYHSVHPEDNIADVDRSYVFKREQKCDQTRLIRCHLCNQDWLHWISNTILCVGYPTLCILCIGYPKLYILCIGSQHYVSCALDIQHCILCIGY